MTRDAAGPAAPVNGAPDDGGDAAFLSALAGRPDPAADPADTEQALALRQALQQRHAALEQAVPPADEALLQTLRFRLRREGLDGASASSRLPLWGLAATVLLGVGVLVQLDGALREQAQAADTLRGGSPYAVELRVASPEQALAEWLKTLPVQAAPVVRRLPDGRIELDLAADPAVLDALAARRIEPMVRSGRVVLVLRHSASAP